MAKVFLTSNGFFTELMKKDFLSVIRERLSNPKAVIITTASPHKEANKYAVKAKNDFVKMGIKQVEFLEVEYEEAIKVQQYNIVYINGGNPFRLLYHMKKSGVGSILKDLAKQNTVFVGVSAGAVILGPSIDVVNNFTPEMNKIEMNDLTALAITEKVIFPHYDREDIFKDNSGKSIEDRLKVFERTKNCSVIRLCDNQYLSLDV